MSDELTELIPWSCHKEVSRRIVWGGKKHWYVEF